MKNKFILLTTLSILLLLVLGCGSLNPFSGGSETPKTGDSKTKESGDKTTSDKVVDEVMPEKTGVEECDDLMAYIAKQSQSKDDNYVTRASREFIMNRIRESLRKSIEEDKNNPEELAKKCKEFKTQLETYKEKEDAEKEEK
jgi:hypothetical protein